MSTYEQPVFLLTVLAALGSGLIAGVFYAFSAFVMKALARLSPEAGHRAMQSINVVVINPWFMTAFLGTGVICVAMLIYSVLHWSEPGAGYTAGGSTLYLAGTILVTLMFNVPRNSRLAATDPESPEAERIWRAYVAGWTAWNHVRTAAALLASSLFSIALSH